MVKSTDKLVYKNANGESIEFSYFSPYTPTEFIENLDSDITTTKNYQQDGETYVSDSLEPRELVINGSFKLSKTNSVLERKLKRTLNPKLDGVLTLQSADYTRQIDVRPLSMPDIRNKGRRGIFSIELVAHDPFWQEAERMEFLALLEPLLHFPLVIPQGGMMFGLRSSILQTEFENLGDVETGFRVVFRARGTVINPEVWNVLTGERLRILYEMEKDDVIEVLSYPGRKQVLINGEKTFQHLDRLNSTFFNLAVGKNVMGYQADENTINLDVIVYYSPAYL